MEVTAAAAAEGEKAADSVGSPSVEQRGGRWPRRSRRSRLAVARLADAHLRRGEAVVNDPMEEVSKLKKLLDSGALAEADFQAKKTGLLARV